MTLARVMSALTMLAGLAIALLGLSLDSILPGGQPGLGLPQLLIVAAGVALAAFGWRLRDGALASLVAQLRDNWLKIVLITVITLLCLEIALTLAGLSTYYPVELLPFDGEMVKFGECNQSGCRPYVELRREMCAQGFDFSPRLCLVNESGYYDADEFVATPDLALRERVMFLGDSFTHGFAADMGYSYVETVERLLPDAAVWNLGVQGTGTIQALGAFRRIAPVMQPQLTILGFYPYNDYWDNQRGTIPTQTAILGKETIHVAAELLDRFGNVYEPDPMAYLRYRRHRLKPPPNELERLAGLTRLGALTLRGLDFFGQATGLYKQRLDVDATRKPLRELKAEVARQGSQFLALVIPDVDDFDAPTELYTTSIGLMRELGVPYLELLDELDPQLAYSIMPDRHWHNYGHGKVGEIVAECVEAFFAAGSLTACDKVALP